MPTEKIAPELQNIGMVTDALWTDYDQDEDLDLMLSRRMDAHYNF